MKSNQFFFTFAAAIDTLTGVSIAMSGFNEMTRIATLSICYIIVFGWFYFYIFIFISTFLDNKAFSATTL